MLVKIKVDESEIFKRENNDLIIEVIIDLKDALFGSTVEVPILLQNKKEKIVIKPCTQPNTKVKFSGLGFPKPRDEKDLNNNPFSEGTNSYIRGDQVVLIKVKIPDCSNLGNNTKDQLIDILNKL